jgi:anti-sigma B factor antagonist
VELTLHRRDEGAHTVVEASGELDLYTAPRLRELLLVLDAEGRHRVVVDLAGLSFIDSTGLGVLVGGLARARDAGGDLGLVCANERVLRPFRITGLTEVFAVHATLEAALAAPPAAG